MEGNHIDICLVFGCKVTQNWADTQGEPHRLLGEARGRRLPGSVIVVEGYAAEARA